MAAKGVPLCCALRALEATNHLHWVVYVSPVFHTVQQLNNAFLKRQVLDRVRMVRASAIGALSPDEVHHVTYKNRHDGIGVYSDRRTVPSVSVRQIRNRLGQSDLTPPAADLLADQAIPDRLVVRLDGNHFFGLAERMVEIGAERFGGRWREATVEHLEALSPFGRARVLGRMIFGAELVPTPAGPMRIVGRKTGQCHEGRKWLGEPTAPQHVDTEGSGVAPGGSVGREHHRVNPSRAEACRPQGARAAPKPDTDGRTCHPD